MKRGVTVNPVRVRFAPSPTGYLHVGGARTALYNYLYAKKMNGQFILRIEDTDEARSTDESLKMVMEDLKWLGLDWDEGPDQATLSDVGNFGPYRQSRRMHIYRELAEQLIQSGKAYYCFMTDAEIDKARQEIEAKGGGNFHVESPYENWPLEKSLEKLKSGTSAVVRFKTRHLKKDYVFTDIVRGEVRFPSDMVGDFVILRSGGMPVFNFCNPVDDHLMKISHVLRAEEHLSNTLRQLMIYEAFGWTPPRFGHLSLILDEDRKKLSKRKGATSCHEFKNEGYLPTALNNFVALLGWSHPEEKELLSMKELIQSFDINRFTASGAYFDPIKLKWMNANHLRELPSLQLWKLMEPFLGELTMELPTDDEWRSKAVDVFKPKLETLTDGQNLFSSLSDKLFSVADESKETLSWESSKKVVEMWKSEVEKISGVFLKESDFLAIEESIKKNLNVKGKHLFMPMRVAVIGKPHGTELKILVPLLQKNSILKRCDIVLSKFV